VKLFQPFKGFFLSCMSALYVTGVVVFILGQFWQVDRGFGLEPSPWKLTFLQMHSIVGLFFMFLFGYLWATHITPGWRRRKKRGTGAAMTGVCIVLFLTVPFIFYATHEDLKAVSVWIHTYLGLVALLPFLYHLLV